MKKIITLLLAMAMIFTLTACGSDTPEPPPTPETCEDCGKEPCECEEPPAPPPHPPNNDTVELPKLNADSLPKIDGSTATIPLTEALVALLLDVPRAEAAEKINFTGTADSFRALMGNRADLVISYEPPPAVIEEADEANFKWELAAIGRDALVFIVNESNPIESITTEEARKIYTGEITNWKELGGSDVEIEPFQRNETSGSQTLFVKLVMGDTPPMTPDTKYISGGMGPLIESVASFNNTGAAIGFSVFYYAQNMNPNDGLKFLAIDGVAPTRDTIRDGSYPHVNDFFAGIAQNEPQNSNARKIFDWLQSEEGKALIEHEGYVSIS